MLNAVDFCHVGNKEYKINGVVTICIKFPCEIENVNISILERKKGMPTYHCVLCAYPVNILELVCKRLKKFVMASTLAWII